MTSKLGDANDQLFHDVDCDQEGLCWDETMRLKVTIDISKPLRRVIKICLMRGLDEKWIKIWYECLPGFCYTLWLISSIKMEVKS